MFCPKCGAEIIGVARFCDRCGSRLDYEPAEEVKNEPEIDSKTQVIGVFSSSEENTANNIEIEEFKFEKNDLQNQYAGYAEDAEIPFTESVNPVQPISQETDVAKPVKKSNKGNKATIIIIAVAAVLIILIAVIAVIAINNVSDAGTFVYDPAESTMDASETQDSSELDITDSFSETTNEATEPVVTEAFSESEPEYENEIPAALEKYKDLLEVENCTYTVKLSQSDWNVNGRSTPVYKDSSNKSVKNVVCKIKSGSEIFVEYIYDDVWAVVQVDDQYVFVSIYDTADSSKGRLLFKNQ